MVESIARRVVKENLPILCPPTQGIRYDRMVMCPLERERCSSREEEKSAKGVRQLKTIKRNRFVSFTRCVAV